MGETITQFTPLPPFSEELIASIQSGLVYVKQRHTQRMNDFLKEYLIKNNKETYAFKHEHQQIKEKVLNRLRSMDAPNIPLYEVCDHIENLV